jgi:hypothetical protein
MDYVQRLAATLTAGAMALSIPASSLASGLGIGVQFQSKTEMSEDSTDSDTETAAELDARIIKRCKHLSGNDRVKCEEGMRKYILDRANAETRHTVRATHGKFMSSLRQKMHDYRDNGRSSLARVRVFLSGLMMQVNTALDTEAELALKVCKDKEDDEKDKCVADAKVKLQAKVTAAIEAMKK